MGGRINRKWKEECFLFFFFGRVAKAEQFLSFT